MTKEFCDICGRPIETHKNVSEFKLKKAVHTLCESWWQKLTVHNACWIPYQGAAVCEIDC